jgi:glycosyltransferase involved in cell wall biosynthesis
MTNKINININSPIGKTGYGITSWNIIKQLYLMDIDISLFPIGSNMELNGEEEKPIVQKMLNRVVDYDPSAPFLKIWHQHDLAMRVGYGDYYAFPFFELDTFNNREKHHLNCCDHIFTSCEWAKQILINNNINIPISIAPLGVDTNIFKVPTKIKLDSGKYIFGHIGKWEKRKSHDFLLKAFEEAFGPNDDVELWLLPHNPFLTEQELEPWLNLVRNNKLKDKIKVYSRLPTQYHLADYIFNIDCGVFLSRAEGWNNEILECMAMNKPIIATQYSAHTEYCNEKNSYLVHIDETEVAEDGKWFFGNGNWAKLGDNELAQTIDYMRYAYQNKITSNPEGITSAEKYSWKNTAKIILDTIVKKTNKDYINDKKQKRKKLQNRSK